MTGSRFRKRSSTDNSAIQPKVLTRSPPSSSQVESKSRPRDPYPIPSSNPASQYTLLEKLGTGSFGTVYKGMHNDTNQIVAIKQIGDVQHPLQPSVDRLRVAFLCYWWSKT